MADFQDKISLLTGGASGLGKATTELLISKGVKVAVLDVNPELGQKTVQELQQKYGKDKVTFLQCDVTNDEQFEECFKKVIAHFGKLDIVVNNAGLEGENRWRKLFEVNSLALYWGTYLGLKYMDKNGGGSGGHVVNIASVAGLVNCPAVPAYNGSKYAAVGITGAFGSDLHYNRTGVKVNCLCPEPIDTGLWWSMSDHLKSKPDTECLATDFLDKRVQKPEDVAKGVVKLIEDGKNGACLLAMYKEGLVYYEPKDLYESLKQSF